jgi:superfamily I DNA/RNA helicase
MPHHRALAALRRALDERQAEAVLAPPGPLLVLAGAGSGKTRVLTERAAAMVASHGQPAPALLVITFTNKAADELRERLERLIGAAARRMTIGTFHALGHRLLRAHAPRAGRSPRFSVYDGHASRRLIAEALEELGAGERLAVRLVALQIGQAKARLIDPTGYRALRDNQADRHRLRALRAGARALGRARPGRPDRTNGRAARRARPGRPLPEALAGDTRRRASGHEPRSARARPPPGRGPPQPDGGGRR